MSTIDPTGTAPSLRDPVSPRRGRGLSGVVGRLATANAVAAALGLISGPVLARALEPSGRGDLAAIVVPFMLAPWLLSLGLPGYAAKAAAQGRSRAVLVGSVGGLAMLVGMVGVVVAVPVADALAEGRDVVRSWLIVGFALLPISLFGQVVQLIANGLERWNLVIAARLAAPVIAVPVLVALYASDTLTVGSAAAVTIFAGLMSAGPCLAVLRGIGRPVFELSAVREALSFGTRVWAGNLTNLANQRLDQLLMIPLVEPAELGFYAVAVTLATFSTFLTGAVGTAVTPVVARGEWGLTARALRVTLAVVATASALVAAMAPWLVPALFGSAFEPAVGMTWILLVAGVPAAGVAVLTPALANAERPGAPAIGELLSLGITLPGLILLLPSLGGEGAAIVSAVAYSANFVLLLAVSTRHFGGGLREFLVPRAADFHWASSLIRRRIDGATGA